MKRILLIGGTDSSGGAGLARDTAVAHELGCLAMPVVTCVTAQTNAAVHMVHGVPASVIRAQINAALAEALPDAIKIGMVGCQASANAIAEALAGYSSPIVLDPVLKASSGDQLSTERALASLLRIAHLVTPNLNEAAALTAQPVAQEDAEIRIQADILRGFGAQSVLIKGGHGTGCMSCDFLFVEADERQFCLPRLRGTKRGTGCSLATALACEIARGATLPDACIRAKQHIYEWMSH